MRRSSMHAGLKSLLPDIAALLVIAILAALFFWKLLFTNQILPRGDVFSYFYPYWYVRNQAQLNGQVPLWNSNLFMGVPFLANSQAGVLYPPNWLLAGLEAPQGVKVAIITHIIWAGWGSYVLARRTFELRPSGALAAGIVFALGGYMTAQVEHVNQIQGLAWLPWIVWLYYRAQTHRKTAMWLGLALAMQFMAGHTQSTFITVFTLGLWASALTAIDWHSNSRLWSNKLSTAGLVSLLRSGWKSFKAPVQGGLVAVGLSAPQLLPTLELAGQSNRSGGLSFREAVSFSLRPEYVGKAFLPSYGDSALFSEYVAFIGILALAIVLVTIRMNWSDNKIRGLTVLCGVGFLFALGAFNPIYWVLVRFVPGFNLFRAPARWLVLWSLGASLILGYGLDRAWPFRSLQSSLRKLWPLGLIAVLMGLAFLAGLSNEPLPGASPPATKDIIIWAGSLLVTAALIGGASRLAIPPQGQQLVLVGLIVTELFMGGRNLPFNRLSSPTAWTSQRPSISTLLAAQSSNTQNERFLSVSDTIFDPGDIRELNAIYAPYLDEKGLSDLLTATKQQEIVAPNLSMRWGLSAVDGFDGGLLPLRDYNTFTRMFVPEGSLTEDGRLRENLASVPDLMWLRAMSVRWVITDKVFDLWQDGVYYDLQFAARIGPDDSLEIGIPQSFEGTAVGLIGHLEGMEERSNGDIAGYVLVDYGSGDLQSLPIQIGADLSEGVSSNDSRHDQARVAGQFDSEHPEVMDFAAVIEFPEPMSPEHIRVIGAEDQAGQIVLRGATLIDQRTEAYLPLNVSPDNSLERIYSGDVKIYEYANTRPRLYLTCNVAFVDSQQAALEMLQESQGSVLAIERKTSIDPTCTESQQDRLYIVNQSAEGFFLNTRVGRSGAYLVVNDSWYPGWTAHIFDSYPNRDWREVPIYRANGMFKAIYLPPGTVGVRLHYPGTKFYTGTVVALTTLLLFGVWLIMPWQPADKTPEATAQTANPPQL